MILLASLVLVERKSVCNVKTSSAQGYDLPSHVRAYRLAVQRKLAPT